MPAETLATTAETTLPADVIAELRRMRRTVTAAHGFFALFPVEADLGDEDRDTAFHILARLLAESGRRLHVVRLTPERWDTLSAVESDAPFAPNDVVLLHGLEGAVGGIPPRGGRPAALALLNVQREAIEQTLGVPLLLWCAPWLFDALFRYAPDFADHFAATFSLRVDRPAPERVAAWTAPDGVERPSPPLHIMNRGALDALVQFYGDELARAGLTRVERARLQVGLGGALIDRQQLGSREFGDRAEAVLREAIQVLRGSGDARSLADAVHDLGMIAQERRRFDEAERLYRESLEIEQRLGNEHGAASTLHQLGIIAQERRRYDEAERLYQESLEIEQRLGNEHGAAITLHQLGRIAHERRRFDEAERLYQESLEIEQRLDNEHGAAITLHQLGRIAEDRRRFDEAEALYRQSLEIAQRLGDEHGAAIALRQLGVIAQECRRYDEAERLYQESLEIEQRLGNEHGAAIALHQLGNIAYLRQRFREAIEYYEQARGILASADDPYGLSIAEESLLRARAAVATGGGSDGRGSDARHA